MKVRILVLLILFVLPVNVVYATTTLNINSNPEGAEIYINGKLNGTTPKSLSFDISSDTVIELKLILNGYDPYIESVTLHPSLTQNIFVDFKKIKAEKTISETESYLNNLKNEYSDDEYEEAIQDAFDILNSAKNYYNSGDYDKAIEKCGEAKELGDKIHDAWDYIKKSEKDIKKIEDSDIGIDTSNYKNELDNAISYFKNKDYDNAKSTAYSLYERLESILDIIKDIDKLKRKKSDYIDDCSDDSLGIRPKFSIVDGKINDAIFELKNGKVDEAKDIIDDAFNLLDDLKEEALKVKDKIKNLHNSINNAKNEYEGIDYADLSDDFKKVMDYYNSAKNNYNNDKFKDAEKSVNNGAEKLNDVIDEYNRRKNYANGKISNVESYYMDLKNRGVIIPDEIPYYINSAKSNCNSGHFEDAKNLANKANTELKEIEEKWKKAKEAINNVKNHFKELKHAYPDIVLTKAESSLDNVIKTYFNRGVYDKVPDECEKVIALSDTIKEKYLASKESLTKLYNKIMEINKSYCVENTLKQYNNIYEYHRKGDYDTSKKLADDYFEKIENAEKKIEEVKKFMESHKYVIIFGRSEVTYSNTKKLLNEAIKLFNSADYVEAKNKADDAYEKAKDEWNKANHWARVILEIGGLGILMAVVVIIKYKWLDKRIKMRKG